MRSMEAASEGVRLCATRICASPGSGIIFRRFTLQISNDTAHHILDVERAFAQIRIVDLPESFGVLRRDVMKDRFDVKVIAFQFAQDLVDQGAIFHHQEMGIENSRVFRPDCFCDLLLHFENLNARLHRADSKRAISAETCDGAIE